MPRAFGRRSGKAISQYPVSIPNDTIADTKTTHVTTDDRELITQEAEEIWVDPSTGDDGNDGRQSSPLATIQEAFKRMPHILQHSFFIHLEPGTYDEGFGIQQGPFLMQNWQTTGPHAKDYHVVIQGDPNDQGSYVIDSNLAMSVRGAQTHNILEGVTINGRVYARDCDLLIQDCTINGRPSGHANQEVPEAITGYQGNVVCKRCTFGGDLETVMRGEFGLKVVFAGGNDASGVSQFAVEPGSGCEAVCQGTILNGGLGPANPDGGGEYKDPFGVIRGNRGAMWCDGFTDDRLQNRLSGNPYHAPNWDVLAGDPYVEDEILKIPGTTVTGVATSNPIAPTVGRFRLDISWETNNPGAGFFEWEIFSSTNDHELFVNDDGSVSVDWGGNDVIDTGTGVVPIDTTVTTIELLRDTPDGDFFSDPDGLELIVDGTSQATATEPTYEPSGRMTIRENYDDETWVHSISCHFD